MLLSILIPTLPERFKYLNRLQAILQPQIDKHPNLVEILYHDAGRSYTTGEKRNNLLARAEGDYVVSVDDDDIVASTYVQDIIQSIVTHSPDVVTFRGWMTTDGSARVDFVIKLGEAYEARGGKYYRFPNHLCPMRRELVKDFKFPAVTQGEDYAWALQINNAGVLKTESHIDKELYHYDFRTNKKQSP